MYVLSVIEYNLILRKLHLPDMMRREKRANSFVEFLHANQKVGYGQIEVFIKKDQIFVLQGVPVLVCQTKLGDRDHRSKKILSKDPCPEMNRLASRRM